MTLPTPAPLVKLIRHSQRFENLVKLSQRLGETTKLDTTLCMLSEEVNVARVEPLSLVEIRLD
jgi:hypothetical protein